jgi:hypothetical protein
VTSGGPPHSSRRPRHPDTAGVAPGGVEVRPDTKQLLISLLAAVVITVLVVVIVTAKIGHGPDSEELHDLGVDDHLEEIEVRHDSSGPG